MRINRHGFYLNFFFLELLGRLVGQTYTDICSTPLLCFSLSNANRFKKTRRFRLFKFWRFNKIINIFCDSIIPFFPFLSSSFLVLFRSYFSVFSFSVVVLPSRTIFSLSFGYKRVDFYVYERRIHWYTIWRQSKRIVEYTEHRARVHA